MGFEWLVTWYLVIRSSPLSPYYCAGTRGQGLGSEALCFGSRAVNAALDSGKELRGAKGEGEREFRGGLRKRWGGWGGCEKKSEKNCKTKLE